MPNTVGSIVTAVEKELVGAAVKAREASPGHFEIEVIWDGFTGKSELEKQRTVLRCIKSLMHGDAAPVHAVDKLITRATV